MRSLRVAFGLLTTLTFRLPDELQPGESGRAAPWYPVVGLVIGCLVWLAWRMAASFFAPLVAGALALGVWISLTGGLHLDGLTDCCDGMFVAADPARRLEIMKDPRLGTFGGVGLVLTLLLKASLLSSLTISSSPAILLAAVLARWCILPAGLLPLARPTGMGADFAAGLQRRALWLGAILPLGISLALGLQGVLALMSGLLAAAGALALAKSRLGGVTGDVFGCVVEVVEVVVLLSFAWVG
ncbi:MAG: adenosylcobinamide-GDP ribazoletransferase [Anaerolineaceae bacterium]|nr:adenosylcobinamide-GDP ribazoletransferase [Anaerolineaceae bacterium]